MSVKSVDSASRSVFFARQSSNNLRKLFLQIAASNNTLRYTFFWKKEKIRKKIWHKLIPEKLVLAKINSLKADA